jgi:hypothetical protein
MKLIIVRLTGLLLIIMGVISALLVINPATSHRVLLVRTLVGSFCLLTIGAGALLLRKWAISIFLFVALCVAVILIKTLFEDNGWFWAIPINVLLLAIPTWACLASWRELK